VQDVRNLRGNFNVSSRKNVVFENYSGTKIWLKKRHFTLFLAPYLSGAQGSLANEEHFQVKQYNFLKLIKKIGLNGQIVEKWLKMSCSSKNQSFIEKQTTIRFQVLPKFTFF
jgi:hypothetical protein